MNDLVVNILGWIGSVILILAYLLNSKNKLTAQSFTYQVLNLLGSFLLIINTVYFGAYPSSAVNVVWVIIGIFYIIKIKKNAARIH